jgi:ABC-type transporter Mla MlaB component
MLRISPIESDNHHAILRLEGRVAGPWVAELSNACERLLGEGRPLELDFTDVSFVDSNGVALIARLASRGIAVAGCSPFVEEQLKSGADRR